MAQLKPLVAEDIVVDPWRTEEGNDQTERWAMAEERAAEIISSIQPNPLSESLRDSIFLHVKLLIEQCHPHSQVFSCGSDPLKTYLPDEDIDITVFSNKKNFKDTWPNEVYGMLKNEEKNENSAFRVKEVRFLQAEVKKIKCLLGNITVNIYFNLLGGLCKVCFLHEVDYLINQNHLFKRSILLIKAWCHYESCILGAHSGLMPSYAVEILVLHLFFAYNVSCIGPLKLLYIFLDFYSKFDWNNFCLSIWGRVPISSLPRVYVEAPQSNNGELRLSLDACYTRYAVYSSGWKNQQQTFRSNFFNVIDPLCFRSNLGGNICEGNFIKICDAFTAGTRSLSTLLNCPKEQLVSKVERFFIHTWHASLKHAPAGHDVSNEEFDILDSDFPRLWRNLQYGRTCPIPRQKNRASLKEEGYIEVVGGQEIQNNVLYKISTSIRAVVQGVTEAHNKVRTGCLQLKALNKSAVGRKSENSSYTLHTWVLEIEEEEKTMNLAEKWKKQGKGKMTDKVYSERRFSRKYREWGVWRPSEEAKLLIRELIRAVAELHKKGHFHGGLKLLRNIAVVRKYKETNNEEIRAVEVTLSSIKNETSERMNFIQGLENDISDLSGIIFGNILGDKDITEYPKDLQDLHDMLRRGSWAERNLHLIAEHKSLSHWTDRTDYLRRIRAATKKGSDEEKKRKIETVLKKMNMSTEVKGHVKGSSGNRSRRKGKAKLSCGEESWRSKVPAGPLLKFLNDGSQSGNYRNDIIELVRFLRNVVEHLNDVIGGGTKKYIDRGTEGEYEDPQYVEHVMTEAFPLLLVELHKGLYLNGIHI